MSYKHIIIVALALSCLSIAPANAQENNLDGSMWHVPKQTGFLTPADCKKAPTSIVLVKACSDGKGMCGSVLALNPVNDQIAGGKVETLTDRNNPNEKLRRRKILGLGVFVRLQGSKKLLVGDGYSPCRGTYGKICLRPRGPNKMEQWSCLSDAGCDPSGPTMLCTSKYTWTRVSKVPAGWKK